MESLKEEIITSLQKELKKEKITKEDILSKLEIPPSSDLGDYSLPCFFLAKKLKKSPNQIAEELSKKIKLNKELLETKQVGAYVNFFVNKNYLINNTINEILTKKDKYGKGKEKGKIIIDFSGPNIGKPMHIGHIRSTILGASILRIYDFLGYDAKGINYLGDIGLHIGKLIVAYELWLNKDKLKQEPVKELLRLYVKFNEKEGIRYQEGLDEEFQDNEWTEKAKEKLKLLELGNKDTHKIWNEITKYSKKGFDEIYKILDVNFHETTGQSFFSEKGKSIITQALKKGLAKSEEDGAIYVELNKKQKKYVLRKNGTASYITQDIGASVTRYEKYGFDKMIYVTDFRQEMHFKQLFEILEKFGFDFSKKLGHVKFGTVKFGDEIMATRKGKVILLKEVLEKTISKADEEIKKRKTKGDSILIGTGALKYSFLKSEPIKDISFSWAQALSFEGNSGPYLQYSYARASSIIKKSKSKVVKKNLKISNLNKQEIDLVKKIGDFSSVVQQACNNLNPSLIANYSFELSQLFNEFYHSCPVLQSNKQELELRLALVECFRIVLKNSLWLLGIEVMEEM